MKWQSKQSDLSHYFLSEYLEFKVLIFLSVQFPVHICSKLMLGCVLAAPGSPWHLTFSLGWLGNLIFLHTRRIICWEPWISKFQNIGPARIFLRVLAQNCNGDYFCHCRYDKLDEEESQQVEFLVFCTSRNVAKAAGEFLKERLVMAADEEVRKASKSKRGECWETEIESYWWIEARDY